MGDRVGSTTAADHPACPLVPAPPWLKLFGTKITAQHRFVVGTSCCGATPRYFHWRAEFCLTPWKSRASSGESSPRADSQPPVSRSKIREICRIVSNEITETKLVSLIALRCFIDYYPWSRGRENSRITRWKLNGVLGVV